MEEVSEEVVVCAACVVDEVCVVCVDEALEEVEDLAEDLAEEDEDLEEEDSAAVGGGVTHGVFHTVTPVIMIQAIGTSVITVQFFLIMHRKASGNRSSMNFMKRLNHSRGRVWKISNNIPDDRNF